MRLLPRRLLLLGGALAIAAGGSAYMASNDVGPTSAGEGNGPVTGYTVSNIDYNNYSGSGCGGADGCYVSSVRFLLVSDSASKPADLAPTFVRAALLNANGTDIGDADGTCALAAPLGTWQVNEASTEYVGVDQTPVSVGQGYGTYSCPIQPTSPYSNNANAVAGLDVTATQ